MIGAADTSYIPRPALFILRLSLYAQISVSPSSECTKYVVFGSFPNQQKTLVPVSFFQSLHLRIILHFFSVVVVVVQHQQQNYSNARKSRPPT